MGHIDSDQKRFKDILKGRIKNNFKRYIIRRDLVIPKGNDKFSLPVPYINLPKFMYDPKQMGGVGKGPGDEADNPFGDEDSQGKPGDNSAEHTKELEVTLEELAAFFLESLQLPNLQNKGKQNIPNLSRKYTSISRVGPRSLAHRKRTYLEALKRSIIDGTYVPGTPPLVKEKDFRYRAPDVVIKPNPQAVVIYGMDVSGSMSDERKELVRTEAFWTDIYLRSQYPRIENKYIIHDTVAKETDKDTFYNVSTSGGTKISSSLELADKIIEKNYPPQEWNIYLFQFSDGDNFDDNTKCIEIINKMLPDINQYAYCEVGEEGSYKNALGNEFANQPKVALAKVNNKIQCIDALKTFLGRGN